MEIEILSMEGASAATEAWRLSRDIEDHPSTETVLPVDAPVNEMPTAFLHFKDFMILEREIFVSPRNHVVWARTSRVDDPLQFQVPIEFDHFSHDDLRLQMKFEASAGKHQDIWRQHLPLVSLSNWTTRISLRDLVKLEGYFRYLTKIPVFEKRFQQVSNALLAVIDKMTGSNKLTWKIIKAYKPVRFLEENPTFNYYGPSSNFSSNNFNVINLTVPISLRAQLVRHRNLQFVDNFYFLLLGEIKEKTIGSLVKMEISASNSIWQSILSKRSCWIAQQDLWQKVIDQFPAANIADMLPCADGSCPYVKDAELRFEGHDPGAPCPRFCNLMSIDKTNWHNKMMTEASLRGQFWIDEVNR